MLKSRPQHDATTVTDMLIERIDQDPKRTISSSIRQSTRDRLQLYRDLYRQTYGGSIDKSEILDRLLTLVLDKDKEFRKFERAAMAAQKKSGQAGKGAGGSKNPEGDSAGSDHDEQGRSPNGADTGTSGEGFNTEEGQS